MDIQILTKTVYTLNNRNTQALFYCFTKTRIS